MPKKVIIIGYGSIGRRHALLLQELGITPLIITRYPDSGRYYFCKDLNKVKEKPEYIIISSPTARHLPDLRQCLEYFGPVKNILIEKPLDSTYTKGLEMLRLAERYKSELFVGYNFRFIKAFGLIKGFIRKYINKVRIIEVVAGQDLRQWRTYRPLRQSYSAFRAQGGGVDLDLSHEIDYVLWILGNEISNKCLHRQKLSSLKIDSPDFFKLLLDYKKYIVDITLDYIRNPKERYLKIICEGAQNLYYDFVNHALKIGIRTPRQLDKMQTDDSYRHMLKAFLNIDKSARPNLCSAREALEVLKVLEV